MNGDPLRKLNILDTISIPLYMSVKRFKSFFMNWSWKLKQHLLLLDSAACECLYAWTKRANCFPMEARVTQSDPTQALTLSNQTLHCKVHGQTRTRWWCPGTALLPKCPGCEAQEPGASRCRQRRSVLHDQVVLSVGSRLPACQGLLPPRATSPSGCGPCERRHAGQTDQDRVCRKYRHKGGTAPGASSANVRRCTTRPGATDRRPAAAAWTGTAATRDKLPPSSDNFGSCSRFMILGEYLCAPGEHTCARLLSSRESVHTWSLSRGRETTCSRVEMPEEGCLLCCRPGLLACDTLALHSCYCSTKGWGLSRTMLGSVENVCIYQNIIMS